jgi:hypothetical protein
MLFPIPELFASLQTAKDATQAKGKADELSLAVKRTSITILGTNGVLDTLTTCRRPSLSRTD